jgi:DNA ligase-1
MPTNGITLYNLSLTEQDVLMYKLTSLLFLLLTANFISTAQDNTPRPILLATKYKTSHEHHINTYWISEKLDGVRGYWNGKTLFTKTGNTINAPLWFTQNWPNEPIEGELWIKRNTFEQVISCVKRKIVGECWHKLRFMAFDSPKHSGTFTQRIDHLLKIEKSTNSPYLSVINQYKAASNESLFKHLNSVVDHGGEGLMLHYEHAKYVNGRSANIMKLKRHDDAEAVVLRHIKGKGKYTNQLGAIQVKTQEGIVFKIGSGFSNQDRLNPPPIGSTITFKYIGKTQRGVPKFASFLRQRIIGNH